MTETPRWHNHRTIALLLLVLALLVFAARGAGHGHDAPPQPGDGLCAVCVYGGSTPGAIVHATALPAVPYWHLRPESPDYRCAVAPAPALARIRGPPALA